MTRLRFLLLFTIGLTIFLLLPLAWRNEDVLLQWIGIGGILLLGVSIIFAGQQHSRTLPRFIVPFALFIGYHGASLTFAPLPQYGIKLVLLNLALFVLFLFFIQSHSWGWKMEMWENILLTVGGLVMVLELMPLIAWLFRWRQNVGTLFPLPPVSFTLPGVLLTNSNVIAGFASLIVPLILIKLWRANHWQAKTGWSLLLTLFVIGTLFSHSRSGWLALLTGAGVTLGAIYLSHRKKPHRIIVPIAIIFAIISAQQLFFSDKLSFINARGDIWRNAWILFTQSPVLGQGVGSFTPLYVVAAQSPPGYVVAHAHNFFLQLLAESGLVGLAIVAVGIWMLIRTIWTQYRRAMPQSAARYRLLALIAAGAALAVHHLGDYLLWHPLYTATFFLLAAIALTPAPAEMALNFSAPRYSVLIGLLILGYIGGALWAGRGDLSYRKGLAATQADDWASARKNICAAAEKYPEKTLFGFQCGMASVRLADETGDAAPISDALPLVLETLNRDPYWSVHRANVAMMLWQAGQRDDAFASMQAVAESTPKNAIFALNAGWMAEELGDASAAREWYEKAITLSPPLANDMFFTMTPLRQSVTGVGEYRSPLADGWDALDAGDIAAAEQVFSAAVAANPKYAAAWAGLAAAQLGLDNPAAERTLATAKFIAPNHFRVVGTAATFAHIQGDDDRAATILQDYLDSLAESTFHTNYYSQPYYFGAYNQVGLPFDLLPQFRRPLLDNSFQPFVAWLKNYRATTGGDS